MTENSNSTTFTESSSVESIIDFRLIPNFERYNIKSNGEVFDTQSLRIIKQHENIKGYKAVNLYDADGIQSLHIIHRLIA